MSSNQNQNFILGCVKRVKGRLVRHAENGENGIEENKYFGIQETAEFAKDDIRLVKIRNYWGIESNWTGPFSNTDEFWENNRPMADKLFSDKKNRLRENHQTFFMPFSDWPCEFNTFFTCRVFPSSWNKFSIDSIWV